MLLSQDETASIKTLQFIKKFDWRMSKKKNQSPVMAALSGPVEKIAFEGNLFASVTAGQHANTFDLAEIDSFWLNDLAAEPKSTTFIWMQRTRGSYTLQRQAPYLQSTCITLTGYRNSRACNTCVRTNTLLYPLVSCMVTTSLGEVIITVMVTCSCNKIVLFDDLGTMWLA